MQMRNQIQLHRRDFAILRSLAEARYLSIQAIEWLHWPGWWARWQRVQESQAAGEQGPHTRYRVGGAVYARLHQFVQAQLIAEVNRQISWDAEFQARPPLLYTLTDHGLRVLAGCDALPLPVATARLIRQPDTIQQHRQIEVGKIYAALRAKVELRGGRLMEWRAAHTLQPHAAIDVPDVQGRGTTQQIRIKPAATCQIQRLRREPRRYFIEQARGIDLDTWHIIVSGYDAYHASPDYQTRYSGQAMTVLVFTVNDQQRERLMHATAQATTTPERYRFRTVKQIHPTSIATGWQAIGRMHEARGQRMCAEPREVNLFA